MNNIQYAYSYFISKGLSAAAAAGIVGNLKAESNVDPASNQQGGPGRGIAQWSEGGRWDTFLAWKGNRNANSLDTQLDFLWHELSTGYRHVLGQLKNADNVYEATRAFMLDFEIPADQSESAIRYRTQFSQDVVDNNREQGLNGKQATGSSNPGAGNKQQGGMSDNGTFGYVQAFLDGHPEVAAIIEKAENQDWTEIKLAGEIKDTTWWKNRTEAQRQWDMTSAESQAQADQMVKDQRQLLKTVMGSAGVKLSDKELDHYAKKAAINGWDQADMMLVAAKEFNLKGGKDTLVGDAGVASSTIDEMIYQYGVPVDRKTRERWIKGVLAGRLQIDEMEDRLREQAKSLYGPNIDKQLDTMTTREILSPYLAIAGDQLGIDPNTLNLRDPKWTRALTDGAKGKMTASEWQKEVRTNKQYGWDKSAVAREDAATMVGELAQLMGAAF